MDVIINLKIPSNLNICPYCLGSGKLKAMQRALIYGGGSTRTIDKEVKCDFCKGKGFIVKRGD